MKRTYWIYSWNLNYHGGVKALHRLQHSLIAAGQNSIIINPLEEQKPLRYIEDDDIVIYPEIISGNPLQGKRVVRWLLNRPGVCSTMPVYEKGDYLTAYNLRDMDLSGGKRLFVNISAGAENLHRPRTQNAYYQGKGMRPDNIGAFLEYAGAPVIITSEWPTKRSGLINLLNTVETLYSSDTNTTIIVEAWLCGCAVKYVDRAGVVTDAPGLTEDCTVVESDTVNNFIQDMNKPF